MARRQSTNMAQNAVRKCELPVRTDCKIAYGGTSPISKRVMYRWGFLCLLMERRHKASLG